MSEELIQKLKAYKERTGKTDRELSEAIGVTEQSIRNWLNYQKIPNSRPTIEAIENYLKKNEKS